ncbi:MAG: hypothetical protein ACFFG0_03770, partial [Candidatus Thorarchaeota archaeon]
SGDTGTSGSSGTSGAAGTSGSSGTSGDAGTSGSSGTSGTSGAGGGALNDLSDVTISDPQDNEILIYDSTSGLWLNQLSGGGSGTSGTSGSSGTSGTSGSSGTSGTSGSSGTSGTSGSSGTSGAAGTSGSSGTSGDTGTSGSSGTSGTSGAGGGALNDLTDVNASAPNDGDILVYDSTTMTWITQVNTGGVPDPLTLSELTVTDSLVIPTSAPSSPVAGNIWIE